MLGVPDKLPETPTQKPPLTNNPNAPHSGLLSLIIKATPIPPTVAWPVVSTGLATLLYWNPTGALTLIIPIVYDELLRPQLIPLLNGYLGTT